MGNQSGALPESSSIVLRKIPGQVCSFEAEGSGGRVPGSHAPLSPSDPAMPTAGRILGQSPAVRRVVEAVLRIASTDVSVFIRGESGVGKSFFARLIHEESSRSRKPLVELVCGTLSEALIESELFGHERGAFTGAIATRVGRFELAAQGTIFLDEIADLTLGMQAKLLRVLQDRVFERVGGADTLASSARVITATNRSLEEMVQGGTFRVDLFHRLNVVALEIPPLRERREDIPLLARSFAAEFGMRHRGFVPEIDPAAMEILSAQCWPGNIRELRNCIEGLVVLGRGPEIRAEDLPARFPSPSPQRQEKGGAARPNPERDALLLALLDSNENRTKAAERLGISRSHLYRLLRQLKLR